MTKIDISSTAVEKGIDGIGSFIGKIINPAIEETGLLLKDQVSMWRFNRQIKMLTKAKDICEKQNINPKAISLKLLTPLIEYSSIEENDYLLDKWAILLSNLVDSEQNIENHVFPYILSQLSIKEFQIIEETYEMKQKRNSVLREEFEDNYYRTELEANLDIVKTKIEKYKNTNENEKQIHPLLVEKQSIETQIRRLETNKTLYPIRIKESQKIELLRLAEYELYNLIRLGLVKEIKETYAEPQVVEIPNHNYTMFGSQSITIDINMGSETHYYLTELGEIFISVCKEKRKD